jgi:3-methyladenine DNA glycosylase Tag
MAGPPPFATIRAAALARHGPEGLAARLVIPASAEALASLADDRYLSAMSRRIFRAGLKHELVDRKWPAFEEVFKGFDPAVCAGLYDEQLEAMLGDRRLIRHLPKLRSIRANARAMQAVAGEHGSFGHWLAEWPSKEIVALWQALQRRFSQLGGNSAPAFLRMVGKDTFLPTEHVIKALRHWQAVSRPPTTRRERAALQPIFNAWAQETGLPYCQLSQILAMSVD